MTNSTDQFIHDQNVKNYSARLLTTDGGAQRATLLTLLAEELTNARLKGWRLAPGLLDAGRPDALD
ncbi:hypothetical protein MCEMIH16_00665 [Caulobacteraceae bacterium]